MFMKGLKSSRKMPRKYREGVRIKVQIYAFLTQLQMLLITKLTPPAALPLRKSPATVSREAEWSVGKVRMSLENRKFFPLPSFEPRSLQLVASLCTDSAAMQESGVFTYLFLFK